MGVGGRWRDLTLASSGAAGPTMGRARAPGFRTLLKMCRRWVGGCSPGSTTRHRPRRRRGPGLSPACGRRPPTPRGMPRARGTRPGSPAIAALPAVPVVPRGRPTGRVTLSDGSRRTGVTRRRRLRRPRRGPPRPPGGTAPGTRRRVGCHESESFCRTPHSCVVRRASDKRRTTACGWRRFGAGPHAVVVGRMTPVRREGQPQWPTTRIA